MVLLLGSAVDLAGQIHVRSAVDFSPIPGATLRPLSLDASGGAVASDAAGQVLHLPDGDTLEVSAIGFQSIRFCPDTLTEPTLTLPPATYAIDQAVVTGQFTGHTVRDAVQSIRVINRSDMDRIGAVSLRDALLTQAALNITQDAQLGSNLSMLGMSGQHVQILVDGLPVIGRVDGNIDLDQLPLDNVERVEIVEGPMSVEYGSEAIAGTINLITKGGEQMSMVRTTAESVGRTQTMGRVARPVGHQGRLEARASRLFFAGFNPQGTSGRAQLWKPKEQWSGELRGVRAGAVWHASSAINFLHERLFNDGQLQFLTTTTPINDTLLGVYEVPFAQDEVFTTRRLTGRIDASRAWASGGFEGFVALNHFDRRRETTRLDFSDLSVTPVLDPGMNDTATFRNVHSRSSLRWAPWERLDLAVGYDAKSEVALGARIESGSQRMTSVAGFASAEWTIGEGFVARPGVRLIWNSGYEAPVVPSLHLRWRRGVHTLRGSFARGFRAPELKELHFLFVDVNHNIAGASDLRAEVSNAWQAQYAADVLTDRALFRPSLQVFHNDVRDVIELGLVDAESQLYTYTNVGRSIAQGATLAAECTADRWKVRVQGTGVERRVWLAETDEQPAENVSLQGALAADWRSRQDLLTLSVQLNHQHREQILQQNTEGQWIQAQLSPNTQVGAFAAHTFFDKQLRVRFGLDNLLNVMNRTLTGGDLVASGGGVHNGGNLGTQPVSMGRNARLTLQWNFK